MAMVAMVATVATVAMMVNQSLVMDLDGNDGHTATRTIDGHTATRTDEHGIMDTHCSNKDNEDDGHAAKRMMDTRQRG